MWSLCDIVLFPPPLLPCSLLSFNGEFAVAFKSEGSLLSLHPLKLEEAGVGVVVSGLAAVTDA